MAPSGRGGFTEGGRSRAERPYTSSSDATDLLPTEHLLVDGVALCSKEVGSHFLSEALETGLKAVYNFGRHK